METLNRKWLWRQGRTLIAVAFMALALDQAVFAQSGDASTMRTKSYSRRERFRMYDTHAEWMDREKMRKKDRRVKEVADHLSQDTVDKFFSRNRFKVDRNSPAEMEQQPDVPSSKLIAPRRKTVADKQAEQKKRNTPGKKPDAQPAVVGPPKSRVETKPAVAPPETESTPKIQTGLPEDLFPTIPTP